MSEIPHGGKSHEDNADVRVVRPVDRSVLGPQDSELVPLSISDDRNQNPDYAAWADINDEPVEGR